MKRKIQDAVAQGGPVSPKRLTVEAIKYFPYKKSDDSFVIPKAPAVQYAMCRSGLPIPPEELWSGYGGTSEEYLSSGREHAQTMLSILHSSNFTLKRGSRILDFGCAAGRMIRELKDLSSLCEIWGTDISAEHIYWCKQHLSPPFYFVTTTTIPHLPFEDSYFDLVYAGSVFTHIDDLAEAWLLELRRVLSQTGRLYITIHDNNTVQLLDGKYKTNWLAIKMNNNPFYAQSKYSHGMLVVGRDTGSQVFYDSAYFLKILEPMFDILSVNQEAYGFQTAILLKKKT
ncbi:MAG TPA: class I SAM-dependent methyltransferase [Thermodesulfovibrionales bacterium]|nr:class I SAM-dependent methyltransferase [Thermodesulfovibrionales bacterium]